MRAACSKCGYQLESLIIDKSVALQDISKKLNRHLESQHKDMVLAMGSALQTGATALLFVAPFAEFVFVPEEEEYVQEKLQEAKDIVMALLGYDPEVEEEEDQDSEDENDDIDVGVIEFPSEESDIKTGGEENDNTSQGI